MFYFTPEMINKKKQIAYPYHPANIDKTYHNISVRISQGRETQNWKIWFVEIDVDRGLDFPI